MKKLILLIVFLCLCVPAYASKVVTPAPSGQGTYAELDGDGNAIIPGYIEAGGDPSKLKLNNNLEDDATSEYAVKVIGGLWHQKVGTETYQILKPNMDNQLAILESWVSQSPTIVGEAFGYPLTYPFTLDTYIVPVDDPYMIEVQEAGGRYVFACEMVNTTGIAVAWDDASVYTKDLFVELQSDGNTPQLYIDYMRVASSGGALQDLSHMIGTDGKTTGAELVGEMDIPTHDFTSGALAADVGITSYALGFGYFPLLSIGYDPAVSTSNYVATANVSTKTDTLIPLSTGKIAYKLTWAHTTGQFYDYSIEINGVVITSGTADYGDDPTDAVLYVTRRIQGSGVIGVFEIFDYGFLISYTE